jgi:23S rRNA pseudouridine955/2504/2580 synthase
MMTQNSEKSKAPVSFLSGVVAPHEDGQRLDRWCKKNWPDVPHGLLQKASRKGDLRLDGARAKPETRIAAGQTITLRGASGQGQKPAGTKPRQLDPRTQEQMRRMILHTTPKLFVLDKPAGLAVQGGSGQSRHLDGMLGALQGDAPERPKLVHRLDRDTSGVLLVARDTPTATALTRAFKEKTVQKVYWALVLRVPAKSRGKITLPMAKGSFGDEKEKMMVTEDGLPAETHYRVIAECEYLGMAHAWVELLPITGRTHQLRVHMEAIGHPILGDVKYGGGGTLRPGLPQQLHLHARRIVMEKGAAGNLPALDVKASLPTHFRESMTAMGLKHDDDGVSLLEIGL